MEHVGGWHHITIPSNERRAIFRDHRDCHGEGAQDMILYLGRHRHGVKLKELGAAGGLVRCRSVFMAIRRHERKLARDPAKSERLNAIPEFHMRDVALNVPLSAA
jgi:hypothetical protein